MAYYAALSVTSKLPLQLGAIGRVDAALDLRVRRGERLTEDDLESLPRQAVVAPMPNLDKRHFGMVGPCWGVSGEFRDMVEDLEPGLHQFAPLDLVDQRGESHRRRFFQAQVLNRVDAVDPEQSDVVWRRPTDLKGKPLKRSDGSLVEPSLRIAGSEPLFTLVREQIEGRHLWAGKTELRQAWFFSDQLMKKVEAADLWGLTVTKCTEV